MDRKTSPPGTVSRAIEQSSGGQTETVRRLIVWFWHDLSHFITAMARGQLLWGHGQLEVLRRVCVHLALIESGAAEIDFDDPYFKADAALDPELRSALAKTIGGFGYADMLASARLTIDLYHELAARVAVEFDLPYPVELERILLDRFAELPAVGPEG
jgi:hypothetical protein